MEPISNNTLPELSPAKRHRRRHSPAFKAEVLAACTEPGTSVAPVAQHYQLNANLIHKWRQAANIHGSHASNQSVGLSRYRFQILRAQATTSGSRSPLAG